VRQKTEYNRRRIEDIKLFFGSITEASPWRQKENEDTKKGL
jgi:hypothetical protein